MNHLVIAPTFEPIETNETDKYCSFVQFDQATLFQLLKTLDATEFKVFMFLTLRAYAWNDKTKRPGDGVTRASGTFVAKGTGISEATAERCLTKLSRKEFISKSHHSCKWGNTYQIKPTLLRRSALNDKAPPAEKPKEQPKTETPVQLHQIEGPKNEGSKKDAPSSIKKTDLAASKRGTNTDSRYLDLSLQKNAEETFENYFSKIRAPMAEKRERSCWNQIKKRNPDVSQEEFLECFDIVSKSTDSKGKPIAMKFLWMSNGFDSILADARKRIQTRQRLEVERQQREKLAQEAIAEQEPSPQEVEQAKERIRSQFGTRLLKPIVCSQPAQSIEERRVFLLNQARQIQQIEKFGNL